jgi:hypothetical protein
MADALILMKKLRNEKKLAEARTYKPVAKQTYDIIKDLGVQVCGETAEVNEASWLPGSGGTRKEEAAIIINNDSPIESTIFLPTRTWDIGGRVGENALCLFEDSVGLSQAGNGATLW